MPINSDYMDESEESGEPAQHDESKEDEGGDSALLPKSLMAGKDFKPGDEIVLEVVKVYGDEFEVRYAQEKKPKSEKPAMDESMDSMNAMASNPGPGY